MKGNSPNIYLNLPKNSLNELQIPGRFHV